MKQIVFFFFMYFCLVSTLKGQSVEKSKIDSLENVLPQLKENIHKADVYISLTRLWLDFDLEKARQYAEKALILCRKLNYAEGEILTTIRLGWYYRKRGNYALSVNYTTEALKNAEKINAIVHVAEAHLLLGVVYTNGLKLYAEAKNHFEKSLEMYTLLKNKKEISGVYNLLARLEANLGSDYRKAHFYADTAIQLAEDFNDDLFLGWCIGAKAEVYFFEKKLDQALPLFISSNEIALKVGNEMNLAYNNNFIGDILLRQGKVKEATQIMEKNIVKAKELKAQEILKNAYKVLARCYASQKKYNLAYKFQDLHTQLKDSLLNLEISELVITTQAKFERQKQDIKIALLEKEKQLALQSNITYLITFILIVLFLTLFLVQSSRNSKKQAKLNKQLSDKNYEIMQQSEELALSNEEISAHRDHLNQMVAERTAILAFQNEKFLEYAHKNAHKVRGPLARILGLLIVIELDIQQMDPVLANYLLQITLNAKELDAIIKDMNQILEEAHFFED